MQIKGSSLPCGFQLSLQWHWHSSEAYSQYTCPGWPGGTVPSRHAHASKTISQKHSVFTQHGLLCCSYIPDLWSLLPFFVQGPASLILVFIVGITCSNVYGSSLCVLQCHANVRNWYSRLFYLLSSEWIAIMDTCCFSSGSWCVWGMGTWGIGGGQLLGSYFRCFLYTKCAILYFILITAYDINFIISRRKFKKGVLFLRYL